MPLRAFADSGSRLTEIAGRMRSLNNRLASAISTAGWQASTLAPAAARAAAAASRAAGHLGVDLGGGIVEPGADPVGGQVACGGPGAGRRRQATASSASGPARTPRSRSRSSALRASGPNTLMSASIRPPPT